MQITTISKYERDCMTGNGSHIKLLVQFEQVNGSDTQQCVISVGEEQFTPELFKQFIQALQEIATASGLQPTVQSR